MSLLKKSCLLFHRNHHHSSPVVQPTSQKKTFMQVRKVMLYPDPENMDLPAFYVVVHFQRPELPIAADDPVYPLQDDVVAVHRDSGEIWFAHIPSVNEQDKTCKMHFYIWSTNNPEVYVCEDMRHNAMEIIYLCCLDHGMAMLGNQKSLDSANI